MKVLVQKYHEFCNGFILLKMNPNAVREGGIG
jgi:hypothetical protein